MDVSLSGRRISKFLIPLLGFTLISCGNRYDLANESGRRARMEDASYHLSKMECAEAQASIEPLYYSTYVNDEIRILMASSIACYARFNLLNFITALSNTSGIFQSLAKTLSNTAGDGTPSILYRAADVLTQSGTVLNAYQRGTSVNSFMVYLQFGVIAALQRNYGSPAADGSQGADLLYETAGANPPGEMSDEDGCALSAAFSHISDSYTNSELSQGSGLSIISSLDSLCTVAGVTSCSQLSRSRSSCDGTNAASVKAASMVTGVNDSW